MFVIFGTIKMIDNNIFLQLFLGQSSSLDRDKNLPMVGRF